MEGICSHSDPDRAQHAEHSPSDTDWPSTAADDQLYAVTAQYEAEMEANNKLKADLNNTAAVIQKLQADLAASHTANEELITKAASDKKRHDEAIAEKDDIIDRLLDDLNQSQRKMRHWRHQATKATRSALEAAAELEEQKNKEMWERTRADEALDVADNYRKCLENAERVEKGRARDAKDKLATANREIADYHLQNKRLEERIAELAEKEKQANDALATLSNDIATEKEQVHEALASLKTLIEEKTVPLDLYSAMYLACLVGQRVLFECIEETLQEMRHCEDTVVKEEPVEAAHDSGRL